MLMGCAPASPAGEAPNAFWREPGWGRSCRYSAATITRPSGAHSFSLSPNGTGWGSVGLAETVSHDGQVEVRQVDQPGGYFVAALEPAEE